MGVFPGIGAVGFRPEQLDVGYRSFALRRTSGGTVTFSGMDFGPARGNRTIVLALNCTSNISVVSVTIGGVSATLLYRPGDATSQPEYWYASVPSGTSGNVVVTMSGTALAEIACALWSAFGWRGNVQGYKNGTSAVTNPSMSINVKAGDFLIAMCRNVSSVSMAGDWTGATERGNVSSGPYQVSVADYYATIDAASRSISVTVAAISRLSGVVLRNYT